LNRPLLESLFFRIFNAFSTSLSNTLTSKRFPPCYCIFLSQERFNILLIFLQQIRFRSAGIKKGQYGAAQ
jgi:hypothetical protein